MAHASGKLHLNEETHSFEQRILETETEAEGE